MLDIATHRSAADLAVELYNLPFEPYAPVRQQLLNLIRYMNRRREAAHLEPLRPDVLRSVVGSCGRLGRHGRRKS